MKSTLEIEHKFLVLADQLPRLSQKPSQKITQGYISTTPVVRIRLIQGAEGLLTIKGRGKRVRREFETEVPREIAKQLLDICSFRLEKTRYSMGDGWVLDKFGGKLEGLMLAEIELPTVKSRVPRPPKWVGEEVTRNSRYANVNLAQKA